MPQMCPHCKQSLDISNPSGYCDHVHYPDGCEVCKELEKVNKMPQLVGKAYLFAKEKHKNQLDDCSLPYFEAHIEQVVRILQQVTKNEHILAAAYLHDTLEDTDTTIEELFGEFDEYVVRLVVEVTHEGEKDAHGRFFPNLRSQEGIMIKFADRLSNISRMEAWGDKRKAQYLRKSKFWNDS